uniref:Uncharacterized protein n=1 Tax=Nelumbo nucifera TaxID=4432 RepID=A0A822ZF00_NELNU|nr:TPA_asm: hypothetical protein HUJ06_003004 [Nelumbo nucifera]
MPRYIKNPKGFRVRVWNPVPGFDGRLKYTELCVVAIGAFINMCIELLYLAHLKFFINGVLRGTEAEVKTQLHTTANQRHPLLAPTWGLRVRGQYWVLKKCIGHMWLLLHGVKKKVGGVKFNAYGKLYHKLGIKKEFMN